jgi:hypothetical protein
MEEKIDDNQTNEKESELIEYKFRVRNVSKSSKQSKIKSYFEELGINFIELIKIAGQKNAILKFEVKNKKKTKQEKKKIERIKKVKKKQLKIDDSIHFVHFNKIVLPFSILLIDFLKK